MSTFFRRILSMTLLVAFMFVSSTPQLEAATKRTTNFPETISTADLKAEYARAAAGGEKVRILIMPGHESDFGGAQFMGQYEREYVVDIAQRLAKELRTDSNLEVLVARGNEGWNDDFDSYFTRQSSSIERFVEKYKKAMTKLEKRGKLKESEDQAAHNVARTDVAQRLYGVSKWANETKVDMVLHLHLNDETGHAENVPGSYAGVALYVPDRVYGNANTSRALAEPIFKRLLMTNATSTNGIEMKGIVEDRDLIAVGAYNTAEMPSILIEYGYLYEPRISGVGSRSDVFADYAHQTALGVKDFFGSTGTVRYGSTALPYQFTRDSIATSTASTTPTDARALYALQASLHELGFYPGTESSLAICPISGINNVCMEASIKAFQASKGLPQTGTLGSQTRVALNDAFNLLTPAIASVSRATTAPAPVGTPSVPSTARCIFTSSLVLNATDADTKGEVTKLQALLAKDTAIYPEGKVTGYFGPATLAAVKRFQTKNAIVAPSSAVYGTVGPATKSALSKGCSTLTS